MILTSHKNSDRIKNNFLAGDVNLHNRACWKQKLIPLCSLVLRNGFFYSTVVRVRVIITHRVLHMHGKVLKYYKPDFYKMLLLSSLDYNITILASTVNDLRYTSLG